MSETKSNLYHQCQFEVYWDDNLMTQQIKKKDLIKQTHIMNPELSRKAIMAIYNQCQPQLVILANPLQLFTNQKEQEAEKIQHKITATIYLNMKLNLLINFNNYYNQYENMIRIEDNIIQQNPGTLNNVGHSIQEYTWRDKIHPVLSTIKIDSNELNSFKCVHSIGNNKIPFIYSEYINDSIRGSATLLTIKYQWQYTMSGFDILYDKGLTNNTKSQSIQSHQPIDDASILGNLSPAIDISERLNQPNQQDISHSNTKLGIYNTNSKNHEFWSLFSDTHALPDGYVMKTTIQIGNTQQIHKTIYLFHNFNNMLKINNHQFGHSLQCDLQLHDLQIYNQITKFDNNQNILANIIFIYDIQHCHKHNKADYLDPIYRGIFDIGHSNNIPDKYFITYTAKTNTRCLISISNERNDNSWSIKLNVISFANETSKIRICQRNVHLSCIDKNIIKCDLTNCEIKSTNVSSNLVVFWVLNSKNKDLTKKIFGISLSHQKWFTYIDLNHAQLPGWWRTFHIIGKNCQYTNNIKLSILGSYSQDSFMRLSMINGVCIQHSSQCNHFFRKYFKNDSINHQNSNPEKTNQTLDCLDVLQVLEQYCEPI